MPKISIILITIFVTLLSIVLVVFGFYSFNNWGNNLRNEGAKLAIETIIDSASKQGMVIFQGMDKDGKKTQLKLIVDNSTQQIKK